jgi:alanine-synthesizing transaminase
VVHPAGRISYVEYAIREIDALARELERRGRRVIRLNIGDPVAYGFQPPKQLLEALARAVEEGFNGYSPSEGLPELREAVAERERRVNGVEVEAEDVVITAGVSEAIGMLMAALVDEGDEVLLPSPCYPVYVPYVKLYGGVPKFYRLVEEGGAWRLGEGFEKLVTPRTKAVVVINPHNPTGAVLGEGEVRRLVEAAASAGAVVVSDEIYDALVFEGRFRSTAAIARGAPIIGLNGFSKRWLATGWRLGYMYFSDQGGELDEVKEAVVKLARTRLCAPTPAQRAAAEALKQGEGFVESVKEEMRKRRDLFAKLVGEVEGLELAKPQATFYAYPRLTAKGDWSDDLGFAKGLLEEEGVAVVHGRGFYDYSGDRFRVVFLPPPDVLEEAVERIGRYISRHAAR